MSKLKGGIGMGVVDVEVRSALAGWAKMMVLVLPMALVLLMVLVSLKMLGIQRMLPLL
jgi:predicted exporter